MLTSLKKLIGTQVGVILKDKNNIDIGQVVGVLGTDPKFPDKCLVISGLNYIIFSDVDICAVSADRISLKLK